MADKELKVKITADNSELKKGLDDSNKKVSVFEDGVKKAGMALAGAFAAGAVINGLKNLVVQLGNTADRLLDLQDITGMTTTKLQEYEHVARVAGVNSEFMASAVQNMTMRMARGEGETSPLNRGLRALGISMKDASGQLRNGADVTEEAITALAAMDNITERNVIGAQMFAGAWKDLAPVLALGADGIEAARKEAHEMGLVLDRAFLEKANESRVNIEKMEAATKRLGQELAIAFVPAVNTVVGALTKLISNINTTRLRMNQLKGFSIEDVVSPEQATDRINKLNDEIKNLQSNLDGLKNTTSRADNPLMARSAIKDIEKQIAIYQDEQNQLLVLRTNLEAEAAAVAAAKAAELAAAEAARLQAIRNEQLKAEQDRVAGLGEIAKLQDDIQTAEAAYIAANSDAERAVWLNRKKALEEELAKLHQIANIRAMASGAPISATSVAPSGVGGTGLATMQPADTLSPMVLKQISNIEILTATMEKSKTALLDWGEVGVQAASSIGMGFMQLASDGKKSIGQVIKQTLAQVTAMLIAKIVTSIPFPANLFVAGGAGMMAGALFNQIPAFAEGGRVTSPTLAMFGEYPGARLNPEYALRQDQLQSIAGASVIPTIKVKGQDFYIMFNEAARRNKGNF